MKGKEINIVRPQEIIFAQEASIKNEDVNNASDGEDIEKGEEDESFVELMDDLSNIFY